MAKTLLAHTEVGEGPYDVEFLRGPGGAFVRDPAWAGRLPSELFRAVSLGVGYANERWDETTLLRWYRKGHLRLEGGWPSGIEGWFARAEEEARRIERATGWA